MLVLSRTGSIISKRGGTEHRTPDPDPDRWVVTENRVRIPLTPLYLWPFNHSAQIASIPS